jgi:hypothetical protein
MVWHVRDSISQIWCPNPASGLARVVGTIKSGAEDGAPESMDKPAKDETPVIYQRLHNYRQ